MARGSEKVFYVICRYSQLRVLYPVLISEGTVMDAFVYPRHVVEAAVIRPRQSFLRITIPQVLRDRSITIIILLNYGSQALGGIDIKVVDHVIVAGEQFYSFAREVTLPAYEGAG